MLDLSAEQFNALINHYLVSCQEALDTFTSLVQDDIDFLDAELPIEEDIGADLIREVGRCVDELKDLNAQVQAE